MDDSSKVHIKRPLKVICACGNGTAGAFAPQTLRAMGGEVIEKDCDLDNTFSKYSPNSEDHHISSEHADLYFNEIDFRWSQRVVSRQTVRRSKSGREKTQIVWSWIPPAMQLEAVLRRAMGRQIRRSKDGGLTIVSRLAVFG